MDKKQLMLEFIKNESNSTRIKEITDVQIKDYDDDNGPMGEHYVVKCKIDVPDNSSTVTTYKTIKSKCLVNIRQFTNFVEKRNSIIWL